MNVPLKNLRIYRNCMIQSRQHGPESQRNFSNILWMLYTYYIFIKHVIIKPMSNWLVMKLNVCIYHISHYETVKKKKKSRKYLLWPYFALKTVWPIGTLCCSIIWKLFGKYFQAQFLQAKADTILFFQLKVIYYFLYSFVLKYHFISTYPGKNRLWNTVHAHTFRHSFTHRVNLP